MSTTKEQQTVFYTAVSAPQHVRGVRMLVDSLRSFGGPLADSPLWVFEATSEGVPAAIAAMPGVQVLPLAIPEGLRDAWYAGKVSACARAEELAKGRYRTAVWLAPDCLIVQPPIALSLESSIDAAVRPVHHRNVGSLAQTELDPFWRRVCQEVGIADIAMTVPSFVEQEQLRAYFNTHAFALNPDRGICCRWLDVFEALALDDAFMSGPCRDVQHRVFLHQAPFSPLIASELGEHAIRILPPAYSYPYNLHEQIPHARRAANLNDLVSVAYEQRSLHPDAIADIAVHEPLRTWLAARAG